MESEFQDPNPELVFATVGGLGADHSKIFRLLEERLGRYRYKSVLIHISEKVLPEMDKDFVRSSITSLHYGNLMDAGNRIRSKYEDSGILGNAVAREIKKAREFIKGIEPETERIAYIVTSLKRPEEVSRLKNIYGKGFYLFGLYSTENFRFSNLNGRRGLAEEDVWGLMRRDENESDKWGQRTRGTFHLSDFFLEDDGDESKLSNQINRCIDLIFANPFITPTFKEYAMFQAFSASLRSADLSRQVGAVIAKHDEILASGANDCPKPMGGLYWPEYCPKSKDIVDANNGRDFVRGYETNARILQEIVAQISADFEGEIKEKVETAIKKSELSSLTEFGRMVHAEMEAILCCARNAISCRGATLYATTFPCHNCAKHIIAAGIKEVVYVEPYPKSKAFEFYSDAITEDESSVGLVIVSPFRGVGPRQFFELFSMNLSSGQNLDRKIPATGHVRQFKMEEANPRIGLKSKNYLDLESIAGDRINDRGPIPSNK